MTNPRRIIAQVIEHAKDHPDVDELFRRVKQKDKKISLATLYRTLSVFEEAGIIEKHDFREGRARYEQSSDDHHDHLIDLETGAVVEFFNEEIEKLKEKIAFQLGYKLVDHRLELYAVPNKKSKTQS